MPEFESQRSIADLFTGLVGDISGLFRKEIQLAKAEASEKIDDALSASKASPSAPCSPSVQWGCSSARW